MTTETTTEATEPTATAAPVIEPTATTPTDAADLAALKADLAAMRADLAKLAEAKAAPVVPSTETPKPVITPVAPDPASLPAFARIAAGYRK